MGTTRFPLLGLGALGTNNSHLLPPRSCQGEITLHQQESALKMSPLASGDVPCLDNWKLSHLASSRACGAEILALCDIPGLLRRRPRILEFFIQRTPIRFISFPRPSTPCLLKQRFNKAVESGLPVGDFPALSFSTPEQTRHPKTALPRRRLAGSLHFLLGPHTHSRGLCLPRIYIESLIPHVMLFEGEAFWEVIRVT